MTDTPPSFAYATLITKSSYLAGVILLTYSLRKHGSQYPLVVLYTPNLPATAVRALELEAKHSNIIPIVVDPLKPPRDQQTLLIAARFADTWTKLRVFSEPLWKYGKVCYLDADMMIFNKNMDVVFTEAHLPGDDWIAATQVCCCNRDKDAWAPDSWIPENCPYTGLSHPLALEYANPIPHGPAKFANLNGGMFVFTPSQPLWEKMMHFFNTSPDLSTMKFPDQDFLDAFFLGKWTSMSWRFNALKTHHYWHPEMWRDDEVVCLHYIVDKPWACRIGEDGVAGYKGRDGETHSWWWRGYGQWVEERKGMGEEELLGILGGSVARAVGEEGGDDEDMREIGSQVQALAGGKKGVETNGSR